jgi:hypothetical protein
MRDYSSTSNVDEKSAIRDQVQEQREKLTEYMNEFRTTRSEIFRQDESVGAAQEPDKPESLNPGMGFSLDNDRIVGSLALAATGGIAAGVNNLASGFTDGPPSAGSGASDLSSNINVAVTGLDQLADQIGSAVAKSIKSQGVDSGFTSRLLASLMNKGPSSSGNASQRSQIG